MKRVLVLANNLGQASYRLRIAALIAPRVSRVDQVAVRLFSMNGTPLGAASLENPA